MTTIIRHDVEVGDIRPDEAVCKGCGEKFRADTRQELMAAAYEHVAQHRRAGLSE